MKRPPPACPSCGSSATLPFEDGSTEGDGQSVAAVILATLLFILSLPAILLLFLLSRASLPAAILLLLALALFWRRRREKGRRPGGRPRPYVCLDCSRNFKAR